MHTTELARPLLRAAEVLQMVAEGRLREDEPVELIEGELVVVTPQGPLHASRVSSLHIALARLYEGTGVVRCQMPLMAETYSLPEPDLCVVREHDEEGRPPGSRDTLLVVECSLTSHALDRRKVGVYARGGVPVYWIVDLLGGTVEVHTAPSRFSSYGSVSTLQAGENLVLPGLERTLAVAELLGHVPG